MKNLLSIIISNKKLLAYTCIIFLFMMHLPFLHADPDINISSGRDAFTDEGLNTSQLRNYINHGHTSMSECDNLIKSPLFNLLLFLPLKIFGTQLMVARLTVLIIVLLLLMLFSARELFTRYIPFLFITTLTQYYIFQYSHFSLSEMLSVVSILAALFFNAQFYIDNKIKNIFLAAAFLSAAYFLKIQFIYITILLPASIMLIEWQNNKSVGEALTGKILLSSILSLLLFLVIYIFCWYLPFKNTFNLVIMEESAGKFDALQSIPKTILFNIVHVLFSPQNTAFNSLVLICFIVGIELFRKTEDKNYKLFFTLSSLWMFIELHKLGMVFLPSRYFVSYYFSAGFMSCVVLENLFKRIFTRGENKISKISLAVTIAVVFLVMNISSYFHLVSNRKFQIENINQYFFSSVKKTDRPILGPWATNATWSSKVQSIPVWKNFMNDKNIFENFHPLAILSEPDEAESNLAYSSQGINLSSLADSSRSFDIGRWQVIVYWLK